jgi:hypothetical protein
MITGKDVAEAIFSDLESCFYYSSKFRVDREYSESAKHHASFVGSGETSRIRMSRDFRDFEVNTMVDIFYVAIILCHECAHYLNKHNDHTDTENLDFTAIETWADYFGGRVFGVLITYGKKIKSIMTELQCEWGQKIVIENIGLAVKDIYHNIYLPNTDNRYNKPIIRVLVFNAGFISFFYHVFNELKPRFTLCVVLTIIKKAFLSEEMGSENPDWEQHSNIAGRVGDIHKSIQGYQIAITPGIKDKFVPILVTNYQLSSDEIEINKNKLIGQMERIVVVNFFWPAN